ncbi:MAG: alpha/beta fold hydrolase [Chloroflexi bacterium]|nr:alpha/beta fold hydrolase [Chloroflexota bacterium]
MNNQSARPEPVEGSIAWWINFKLTGSWLVGVTALAITIGFIILLQQDVPDGWTPGRVVAAIVSLLFALQMSFILAPDNEPALELLNSYPRRLPLIVLERVVLTVLLHGIIAAVANLVGLVIVPNAESFGFTFLRWMPPMLFIGGTIFLVVQFTRQGVLGALMALMLWAGLFFGGDAALYRWPFLQPIHAFLQPQTVAHAQYMANRLTLLVCGSSMIAAALYLLQDEERVLGLRTSKGWQYWAKRAPIYGVATAVIFYIASVGLWIDEQARRTEAPVCCLTPGDVGLSFDSITFTSPDGIVLDGWHIPSQNGANIILLHGYGGHRAMMLRHAQALATEGFGVLMYDLRGHSRSGGDERSLGWADVMDVETAVAFLNAQPNTDPNRIGILGFSIGGQIALRATAQLESIQAVVADGPSFANIDDFPPPTTLPERLIGFGSRLTIYGFSLRIDMAPVTAVIDQIDTIAPRPILFIATGTPDGNEQQIVQHFYNHAAEPKSIWTIPEATHGGGMSARSEAYSEQITTFFHAAFFDNPSSNNQ